MHNNTDWFKLGLKKTGTSGQWLIPSGAAYFLISEGEGGSEEAFNVSNVTLSEKKKKNQKMLEKHAVARFQAGD